MTTTTAIPTAAPTATPTRRRFTVAEYHAMAHAGILTRDDRVELLDGDLILMPPIGGWHAARVNSFIKYMHPPLQDRVVFAVQNPTRLNDLSEPQPDVMLLRMRDDLYEDSHPSPEDVLLLIEVADTTLEYDRGAKLSAYARAGIPEVWIVTRKERRIESYTDPSGDKYSTVRHFNPGETIAPQAFPDVSLQVNNLIAR